MSFLKTILNTLRSAAHAVSPTSITGMTEAHKATGIQLLAAKGYIKPGTRSCTGKFFTVESKRPNIDLILGNTLPAMGKVFNFILAQPHAVDVNVIKAGMRFRKSPDASLRALVNLGALKQHRSKGGHYYSNPDHRQFFAQMFFGEVGKYDVAGKAMHLAAVRAEEDMHLAAVRAEEASRPAPVTVAPATDACPTCGRADAQPEDVEQTQDLKAQVLALLRLSKHGVTIEQITDTLNDLEGEGIIRTDERDEDEELDYMRWFVRKSKRPEADDKIASLIAGNTSIMAKIDAIVPAS